MFEGAPNQERASRERVIESLKQDPEDFSVFRQFVDEKDLELKEANADSKATIAFNIELAEICLEAGLLDDAYERFLDVRDQARQEGDDELADRMQAEADKLRE